MLRARITDVRMILARAQATSGSGGRSVQQANDIEGLYQEEALGFAEITAVSLEGDLTLNTPLIDQLSSRYTEENQSDIWIYLTRAHDHTAPGYAGRSGFTFARVMSDEEGLLMVPHFVATDIVRDNRLKPGKPWKSTHLF